MWVLMSSFGARVCADWVSLGLWISPPLFIFGIAGYFCDCVMGGPGLARGPCCRRAPRRLRGWEMEIRHFSPNLGRSAPFRGAEGAVPSSRKEVPCHGGGSPGFGPRASPCSRLRPRAGSHRARGDPEIPTGRGDPLRRSLLLLCVLCLSSGLPPVGGAFTNGLSMPC